MQQSESQLLLNIIAILLSPIIAVIVTLFYQSYKSKRDSKMSLFLTLFMFRQYDQPSYQMVNALNTIDIVFSKNKKVLEYWHHYYGLMKQKAEVVDVQDITHTYINMLSAMSQNLGYKKLLQTDIDKYYYPQRFVNQDEMNREISEQWLRVLKNTAKIEVNLLPNINQQEIGNQNPL